MIANVGGGQGCTIPVAGHTHDSQGGAWPAALFEAHLTYSANVPHGRKPLAQRQKAARRSLCRACRQVLVAAKGRASSGMSAPLEVG